jgi:hypothetical protein
LLVFVDEAAEDGLALDLLLGEVGDRVAGPGWAELAGRARSGSGGEGFDNLVVSASL